MILVKFALPRLGAYWNNLNTLRSSFEIANNG
jgi:hypothetical protein